MPSPLYASLQPAWTFLSQKLIWFALTPETRHVSAASRVLAQVAPLMANYMPELEATGTREPRACTYIRRWMWFLAHAANEPIPEFARIDIFNVTQEANFCQNLLIALTDVAEDRTISTNPATGELGALASAFRLRTLSWLTIKSLMSVVKASPGVIQT
ncbi:hypothetical protein BDZ97DRAFT_1912953 [Flammula alnicola]|nr:hypothetical protein BDZ97DRAFT_1912953 [Flammula alnicola]